MLPVTVVIPTRNEARNLPSCLARLSEFAAIWVVDSGSTDETLAIARDGGARVIEFAWSGKYPKKRNWVLMNERFDTPWVLFLDADEQMTPAAIREMREVLPQTENSGFWLRYTNYFMGKPLRHGDRQRKLCLFRVGTGLYERIEDERWSTLDMEVHEHPQLEGPVGAIAAPVDHHDFRGIAHFLSRHNDYSTWEARRQTELTIASPEWLRLTRRQRLKYRAVSRWWFAPAYFVATYLGGLGFLDGRAGLHYALLKFAYFHDVKLKIDEAKRTNDTPVK